MRIVQQRTASTSHVAPGTVVHTDEWSSYRRISSLPNVTSHGVVNHSVTFVDPCTGVHTQHVESYWNRVKVKLKRMRGCHSDHIPSYLDEYMWMERYGTTPPQTWLNILRDNGTAVSSQAWDQTFYLVLITFYTNQLHFTSFTPQSYYHFPLVSQCLILSPVLSGIPVISMFYWTAQATCSY